MGIVLKSASLWIVVLLLGPLLWTPATANDDWFVSLYAGQFSNTVLIENLRFKYDFEDSNVYVLSAGKALGTYKDWLGFELEGQVGTHQGKQSHQEVNCALTLRWLPFPWDDYIDTSFAFGNGLSYATEDPAIEIELDENNEASQWLYYILLEWAFSLHGRPNWNFFLRIHHRSGVYGRMAGDDAVTNFVGVGLRYRFGSSH